MRARFNAFLPYRPAIVGRVADGLRHLANMPTIGALGNGPPLTARGLPLRLSVVRKRSSGGKERLNR